MKADKNIINEIERLLEEYEIEIDGKRKEGILENYTANTFLVHAKHFVKWCKGDFVPCERKLK